MSTSGSVDWTTTRDEIIKAAYRLVLVDEDFSPTTNQTTNASLLLNAIVKSYNATLGMPLWAMSYGFILPFSTSYNISVGSHIVSAYATTTLTADSAASDTTLTVDSITGFSDTNQIGVELDDGSIDWTTISGAPSGSTITLTAGVTSAASSGNCIYAYATTARIKKPLRVLQAYTIVGSTTSSISDVPVRIITTEEFLSFSNKNQEQYPLYLNYEPLIDSGTFRVWPRFSSGERVVLFRYHRMLEDFDAGTDTPDFPVEWNLPLIYELAVALAPTYNMEINKLALLRRERDKWVSEVAQNDYEEGSIIFQPNRLY